MMSSSPDVRYLLWCVAKVLASMVHPAGRELVQVGVSV